MENKLGMRYDCCFDSHCENIDSVLHASACYERGGRFERWKSKNFSGITSTDIEQLRHIG